MRAVDTNVVVRLIVRDDVEQAAAADRFVSGGAWIGQVVLAEVAWVLESVYGLERTALGRVVEMLLDHESLVVEDAAATAQALRLFREHPRVGFADCLVRAAAERAGHLPLGSFDRDLARLPGVERLGRA